MFLGLASDLVTRLSCFFGKTRGFASHSCEWFAVFSLSFGLIQLILLVH